MYVHMYMYMRMYILCQTNLDSVEALIRKHGDFEKSLDAQEEKINALDETATKLVLADHYDVQKVTKRRATVTERYYSVLCQLDKHITTYIQYIYVLKYQKDYVYMHTYAVHVIYKQLRMYLHLLGLLYAVIDIQALKLEEATGRKEKET